MDDRSPAARLRVWSSQITSRVGPGSNHRGRAAVLLGALLVLGLTAILVVPSYAGDTSLVAGQPSPGDIVAPYAVSYPSRVLTDQQRDAAERAVPAAYGPRDPAVGEAQRVLARDVLQHVALVRANTLASPEQRRALIAAVPELGSLAPAQIDALLELDNAAFLRLQVEVPRVVGLKMRSEVKPTDVPLRTSSLSGLVDPAMDDAEAQRVAQLAALFIAPNTEVDEAQTELARMAARDAVEIQTVDYAAGQTVVREGDPLSPRHLEAMEQLGLLRGSTGWRETIGWLALMTALVAIAAASLDQLKPGYWRQTRPLAIVVAFILIFAFGASFAVPGHVLLGYAYPAAALGMTLTVLFGLEHGLLAALVLAIVIGLTGGTDLEATTYVLLGSLAGSIALGRIERFTAFLAAGLAVALADLAVLAGFHLSDPTLDLQGASELVGTALVHAALSTGLAALGALAAGALFGVTTSIQLLELARPNHPLLRQLQLRAPGTYQHSILISNLGEAAATAIGADALLVRVAAYYHDVGKTLRPYFFIENQVPGQNPHDGLDAYASARIILSHVTDGADLARRFGLPGPVTDAIWQHHGTTRVEYFYHRAVELLGEEAVAESAFRYPGPRPQSREMAILMLADGAEAAVRAASPGSSDEIDAVLRRIIRDRLNAGQLEHSDLTLRDLAQIRASFVSVLKSVYHPRIKYPTGVEPVPGSSAPAGEGQ